MSEFDYERDTRRGYLDPDVARAYEDRSRGRGQGLPGAFGRVVTHRERRTISLLLDEALRGRGTAALLDVPCGAGKLAVVLRGRVSRVVAADVSPAMLDRARAAFNTAGVPAEFRVADAVALPFSGNEFDVVVCLRLLHRVPPDTRLAIVRELARVSARYVILSLGVLDAVQRFRLALRGRILRDSPLPVPCTLPEARALLAEAGLDPVRDRAIFPGLSTERIFLAEKR